MKQALFYALLILLEKHVYLHNLHLSNGFKFVTRSCASTKEKIKMEDGRELPLYKLDTSSESHPFYTGTQKSVDNMGGRVEKFRNRFGKTSLTAAK